MGPSFFHSTQYIRPVIFWAFHIGAPLKPTVDVAADMQYFRDLYADKTGKRPELFGPVRLREEGAEKGDHIGAIEKERLDLHQKK